jgi:hypothetical protein
MKSLLFLIVAALLAPIPAPAQIQAWFDGMRNMASMERKVRDVVEVDRTPLFDNAPFLRLRAGDKLVKAREVREEGKPIADPDKIYFYLFSKGKYFQLWVNEEGGKVLLSEAFSTAAYGLLFDWDFTMENAKALRKLLSQEHATSLTPDQLLAIYYAVRPEFPELEYRTDSFDFDLDSDHIVSIPGHQWVEFEGLAFDHFCNCIYRYTAIIGPSVCSVTGLALIQGPKRVERGEFERENFRGPNGPGPGREIDPKVAKAKRAEYERMRKFQDLVAAAIKSKGR